MRTKRLIADRYSLVEQLPGSTTGICWRTRNRCFGQLLAITRIPVSGQPLSWSNVEVELRRLRPGEGWTAKRAEHIVAAVRARLVKRDVAGLTRDEVGEPVGNALNSNLILELLLSTTLVPPDLRLLD